MSSVLAADVVFPEREFTASATGGSESISEGRGHAFEVGAVPAGKVRYDNLKAAVARVIGDHVGKILDQLPVGALVPKSIWKTV